MPILGREVLGDAEMWGRRGVGTEGCEDGGTRRREDVGTDTTLCGGIKSITYEKM